MRVWHRTLTILLPVLTLVGCQKNFEATTTPMNLSKNSTGIVNGHVATGKEPWAASVVGIATVDSVGLFIFCTGSIIDENTVVTAAHCMEDAPKEMLIVFGLGENDPKAITRKVIHHEFHEMWPTEQNNETDTHDIGMAHFEGGLPEGFKPAQLLDDSTVLVKDAPVLLAGYGVTNGMSQAGSGTLRFTNNVKIRNPHFGLTEVELDEKKSGTCNGDSGGPAMIEVNGTTYLFGITSRGASLCNDDGVYTVIPAYKGWINTHKAWAPEAAPVNAPATTEPTAPAVEADPAAAA